MDITFYSLNKKQNSTKQPTDIGVTYSCIIKESCSILSPVINLDIGVLSSPVQYNYAYIPDWNRYYFVRDWTFATRLWSASLEVDVLATYKTQIASSNMYVMRSASLWDRQVIDTLYPAKIGFGGVATNIQGFGEGIQYDLYSTNGLYHSIADGSSLVLGKRGFYYITVLSNKSGQAYITYCLNYSGYSALMTALFNVDYSTYDKGSLTNDVYKYIADPLQWIVSVKWCPFEIPTEASIVTQNIQIGGLKSPISVACKEVPVNEKFMRIVHRIGDVPDHPEALTRGYYLNDNPNFVCILDIQPFGIYNLDRNAFGNGLTLTIDVDIFTGQSILTVYNATDTFYTVSGNILAQDVGTYMVDIPIAQTKVNTIALAGRALSIAGQNLTTINNSPANPYRTGRAVVQDTREISEGVQTPTGALLESVGNALTTANTDISTRGVQGAFVGFRTPRVNCWWGLLIDADVEHNGRPLCKEVVLDTLSGYIQCRDGDITLTNATQNERIAVGNYLTSGFFLE